jgi:hypothetical protein
MVIGSFIRLKIGEIVQGRGFIQDVNRNRSRQPFLVLEEVTQREWEEYIVSQGKTEFPPPPPGRTLYFYRISTD